MLFRLLKRINSTYATSLGHHKLSLSISIWTVGFHLFVMLPGLF